MLGEPSGLICIQNKQEKNTWAGEMAQRVETLAVQAQGPKTISVIETGSMSFCMPSALARRGEVGQESL